MEHKIYIGSDRILIEYYYSTFGVKSSSRVLLIKEGYGTWYPEAEVHQDEFGIEIKNEKNYYQSTERDVIKALSLILIEFNNRLKKGL